MFVVARRVNEGIEFVVPPSDREVRINLKVLQIYDNRWGKLECKLGLIAPDEVKFNRHESIFPAAFEIDPELSENNQAHLKNWALDVGKLAR